MKDVLYVSNNCHGCEIVLSQLSGIPIQIRNVDQDVDARATLFRTGRRAVPTAVISGYVLTGAHEILAALRRKYGG